MANSKLLWVSTTHLYHLGCKRILFYVILSILNYEAYGLSHKNKKYEVQKCGYRSMLVYLDFGVNYELMYYLYIMYVYE